MCGIAGVLNLDGATAHSGLLRQMADQLRHRGPDDEGLWADGPVGFSHRRLMIIDLTAASHQPMSSEDAEVVLIYNGEIYNYLELRLELEALGYRFRSQGDAETILHAYQAWGEQCLDRFNGIFAFAIWNKASKTLFLARDRFGVKPLYYYQDADVLVFASEIKAILKHPGVRRGVSIPALNEYFTFQNILTDRTLFEGIKLLPAGSCLTVETARGDALLRERRYWEIPSPSRDNRITMEEATEEITRLFEQAVTRQLMTDVPLGVYLSGGMDSGSITTIARQKMGRICTFTAGFDLSSATGLELAFDEREASEALANLLKTEHYETVLHAGDMEHVMPDLIWHLEDLRVGQCYPNYYVSRLASKFVRVVLSGAGGDEIFGGYPWRYQYALASTSRAGFQDDYYGFWQRLVKDQDKSRFFSPDVAREIKGHPTREIFDGILNQAPHQSETVEDRVEACLYFDAKTFLHGLLVVEDKLSMAHGLEARVPFLDNDLAQFGLTLPARLKVGSLAKPIEYAREDRITRERREVRSSEGKLALRQAMRGVVPAGLLDRPKQGFSAPDAAWFRGESIDYVGGILSDRKSRIYDFLDPAEVRRLWREHAEGIENRRLLIWSLLSFEWWLRKFQS
ncbi:MAG: asparagine synthase (glutamine-hydrolyzing) [Vicinamibacteria bacterium]